MRPEVSVVIPVFNGSATIERALQSVFRQSSGNYEVIVVDDGSTDSSKDILRKYESRITLLTQENLGTTAARNLGAKLARGEYLAFLDQDDWWVSEKITTQVQVLERRRSFGLAFANLYTVDYSGNRLGFMTNRHWQCHSPSSEELLLLFPLYPSSATLRKDLFDSVGGFDTRFGLSGAYGDQDLHIRLRGLAPFHFISSPAGFYYWQEERPTRIRHFLANLPSFVAKYYEQSAFMNKAGGQFREKFILRCTENLNHWTQLLLRSNGNRATPELLEELNGYYNKFRNIFGNSFLIVAGQDALRLNRYDLDAATSTMLLVFLYRPELQTRFPEVFHGDLSRFIEWAHDVASGIRKDPDRNIIQPFTRDIVFALQAGRKKVHEQSSFYTRRSNLDGPTVHSCAKEAIVEAEETTDELDRRLRLALSELRVIHQSLGFRLLRRTLQLVDRALPDATLRGNVRLSITESLRILSDEGVRIFLGKAREKIKRKEIFVTRTEKQNAAD